MDKELRHLARLVATEKVSSKKIEKVLEMLPASELKKFLKFLKIETARNTVTITTATPLAKESMNAFEKEYAGKRVVYTQNEDLGAGVVVKIDDDVYDYTVRNYLATTIANLENEL